MLLARKEVHFHLLHALHLMCNPHGFCAGLRAIRHDPREYHDAIAAE
jgi:hypothetical protein